MDSRTEDRIELVSRILTYLYIAAFIVVAATVGHTIWRTIQIVNYEIIERP